MVIVSDNSRTLASILINKQVLFVFVNKDLEVVGEEELVQLEVVEVGVQVAISFPCQIVCT